MEIMSFERKCSGREAFKMLEVIIIMMLGIGN